MSLSKASPFVKNQFELLDARAKVPLDVSKPFRVYLRGADSIYKQASIYLDEQDFKQGYILMLRYLTLGVDLLPKHPDYKKPAYVKDVQNLRHNLGSALEMMEGVKPKLIRLFEHLESQVNAQHAREERKLAKRQSQDASFNQVVSLLTDPLPSASLVNDKPVSSNFVPSQPRVSYHLSYNPEPPSFQHISEPVAYPRLSERLSQEPNMVLIPHPIPFKPMAVQSLLSSSYSPDFSSTESTRLRRLHLPSSLSSKFLKLASSNTSQNLETCGILCGTLKSNQLYITTLIIPKQSATPNSCTTTDEIELFEYQDSHSLMTFGWIHTHPSQSCFMSSVDLHTHCSYQLMLPEAIAIVMAPSKSPPQGVFSLSDSGLELISNCRDPAMFHPHSADDESIYGPVGSHLAMEDSPLDIVDLRHC